jgi:hypothetical protein
VLTDSFGAIKQTNAGFAVRCEPNIKFVQKRLTNASNSYVLDCPCYHYGYVMSDVDMLEKLATWGHARDFNVERWFRYKWVNWRESTRYLHPTHPREWMRAIRFPLQQPDFAERFALSVRSTEVSVRDVVGEAWFNARIGVRHRVKAGKRTVLSVLRPGKVPG